jgi:glutathione S-transferase
MSEYTLYIGNRTYSSWSLRGWLACKTAQIDFDAVVIPLYQPDTRTRYRAVSPGGKVPVLHHGKRVIWESLAICFYLAEQVPPALPLWPRDPEARAWAQAISAEMHAGFAELRRAMWMNVRKRFPGKGRTPGALADIARVTEIWRETRARFAGSGPFLFGDAASLADCMYAPVVARFWTWEPELPADAKAYVEAIWAHPAMREWVAAAHQESWVHEAYDNPA